MAATVVLMLKSVLDVFFIGLGPRPVPGAGMTEKVDTRTEKLVRNLTANPTIPVTAILTLI